MSEELENEGTWSGLKKTIVKEVPAKDEKKLTPAKKKEGDEFKEEKPLW